MGEIIVIVNAERTQVFLRSQPGPRIVYQLEGCHRHFTYGLSAHKAPFDKIIFKVIVSANAG